MTGKEFYELIMENQSSELYFLSKDCDGYPDKLINVEEDSIKIFPEKIIIDCDRYGSPEEPLTPEEYQIYL